MNYVDSIVGSSDIYITDSNVCEPNRPFSSLHLDNRYWDQQFVVESNDWFLMKHCFRLGFAYSFYVLFVDCNYRSFGQGYRRNLFQICFYIKKTR